MEYATITLEEMRKEAELFRSVYPQLMGEILRIENARGKLNDFQLMLAVSHAKNGLGILSFERRQRINAIFEAFTDIYRKAGRTSADQWVKEAFGFGAEADKNEDLPDASARIEELAYLIHVKEAELLKLYREYFALQNG